VAPFCVTLQCGKNKEKYSSFPVTMKRIVVAFLCCPSTARSHAMPIAQTSARW